MYLVKKSKKRNLDKTSILEFNIQNEDLSSIISKKQFNYTDDSFLEKPYSNFKKGSISIISDLHHSENYNQEEFNIDPSLWYILDITLDEKKYPSFYSMKLNGDLNEDLSKAIFEFELKKTKYNKSLKKTTKNILSSFFNGLTEKKDSKYDVKKLADDLISKLINDESIEQVKSIIKKFLKTNEIPFDLIGNNFVFSASSTQNSWIAELSLQEDQSKIILSSSIKIDCQEQNFDFMLNDLNEINSRSENGFFFIDQHKNELFFKNQIDLNVASLEKNLDNLMKSNFRSIDFLIDLLKAKHNGRINFINY